MFVVWQGKVRYTRARWRWGSWTCVGVWPAASKLHTKLFRGRKLWKAFSIFNIWQKNSKWGFILLSLYVKLKFQFVKDKKGLSNHPSVVNLLWLPLFWIKFCICGMVNLEHSHWERKNFSFKLKSFYQICWFLKLVHHLYLQRRFWYLIYWNFFFLPILWLSTWWPL